MPAGRRRPFWCWRPVPCVRSAYYCTFLRRKTQVLFAHERFFRAAPAKKSKRRELRAGGDACPRADPPAGLINRFTIFQKAVFARACIFRRPKTQNRGITAAAHPLFAPRKRRRARQGGKRNMKKNRHAKDFWKGKGFYLALALVIAGAATASFLAINSMMSRMQQSPQPKLPK